MSDKTKTPEQLEKENTKLQAANERLSTELATAQQQVSEMETIITDLSDEVRALNATKGNKTDLTTLPDGKRRVQVLSGGRVGGVRYTAAQLAARPDLCEKLVEKKSGLVQLINA